MLRPKGPDRLLAIEIYLSLQKHSVDATPRHNKTRGRQSARVTVSLMAVQGFPVNQSIAASSCL